jgi:hypothetical protein
MDLKIVDPEGVDWFRPNPSQDGDQWLTLVDTLMNHQFLLDSYERECL